MITEINIIQALRNSGINQFICKFWYILLINLTVTKKRYKRFYL